MRDALAARARLLLGAAGAGAQEPAAPVPAPLELAHLEAPSGAPRTVTLQDALQRARENETQFQAVVADAASAREDRVQAKAGLLPVFSFTTQYLGNQANGVNPNGRFVSMDGVNMYRAWVVMRQDLSPGVFMRTPLHKADAAEAMAQARLEIAQRGLAVTVTRSYYALVAAQRRYATVQLAAQQASRFVGYRAPAGAARAGRAKRCDQGGDPVSAAGTEFQRSGAGHRQRAAGARGAAVSDARRELLGRGRHAGGPRPPAIYRRPDDGGARQPGSPRWPARRSGRRARTSKPRRTPSFPASWSTPSTASKPTSSRCTAASRRSRSSASCRTSGTSSPST